MLKHFIVISFFGISSASQALSCAFHGYAPPPTMVEKMLLGETLVLAAPSPTNPFRFTVTEVIGGAPSAVEIPHLVDSAARKRFANAPQARVLFSMNTQSGKWERLTFVDAQMAQVLAQILLRLSDWRDGNTEDRAAFFAALLGSPQPQIHNLAMAELDLLDYGVFRSLGLKIDHDRALGRLGVVSETNLKPIRVMLLGLSDQSGLRDFFRKGVLANATTDGPMLGAYAIALLEYEGSEAARWLAHSIVPRPDLTENARSVLVGAMSLHDRAGDPGLSPVIRHALGASVLVDANLARLVNSHFDLGVAPDAPDETTTLETFTRLSAS